MRKFMVHCLDTTEEKPQKPQSSQTEIKAARVCDQDSCGNSGVDIVSLQA